MYRFLLGICTLALSPLYLHGNNPYFIQFDTQDGLPGSEVYDVALDVNGVPWFATDRGVCSYNGYEFTTYATRNGLSDNSCLGIQKGPEGKLWFFGLNGTLCHQSDKGIEPFWGNAEFPKLLGSSGVPEGFSWQSNGEMYFWFWTGSKIHLISYRPDDGGFNLESLADSLGHRPAIRIGATNYYQFFGRFVPDLRAPALIFDQEQHAYSYQLPRRLVKKYLAFPDSTQQYLLPPRASITELYFDAKGDLWVTSSQGLFRFPQGDLTQAPLAYFPSTPCSSILQDREGNYWLTTLEDGVYLIPSFDILRFNIPSNKAKKRKISALACLENHLIFATYSGEIYALDRALKLRKMHGSEQDFALNTFASQTDQCAMVGRYRFQENASELKMSVARTFSYRSVSAQLSNGDVFFGGSDGWIIHRQDGTDFRPKAFPWRVHSVLESGNRIWIGTIQGLGYIDNFDYPHCKRLMPASSLLDIRINDIQEDGFGNLWVSTIGNSLLHLGDSTLSPAGINSDLVNASALERPGVLWVACNDGLRRVRYTYDSGLQVHGVDTYTTEDGLPDNYIVDVAIWNETVWLATNKGLAYFPARALDQARARPEVPVLLQSVKVNNVLQPVDSAQVLRYDHNDLTFHFLGTAFRKPRDQAFYRYSLLSQDINSHDFNDFRWNYTNERTVRYLNLPPGRYQFWVAASNRLGSWGQPQVHSFYIRPHYSQTLAFQIWVVCLALLLVAGILAYFSWRYRQQQIQRRRLQEAKLKAQEAEISTLRSQMNPHFVFNALNAIQSFIFKKDVHKANHFLHQFSTLIRDGLRFSRQKTIPLSEELAFLRAYLELESMRFPGRFTYHLEVEETLQSPSIQILPFLFQPLLENAIKHAFKDIDYPGVLQVRVQESTPGWISVEIRDNGPGFEVEELPLGNPNSQSLGLKIVQDRVTLLQAEPQYSRAQFELINLKTEGSHGILAHFLIPMQT